MVKNKWHDIDGNFFSDCEMEMIRELIKQHVFIARKALQDEGYISQIGEEKHKYDKYRVCVLEMFLECTKDGV